MSNTKEITKRLDNLIEITKGLEALILSHSVHLQGLRETIVQVPHLKGHELQSFLEARTKQAAKHILSAAEQSDPEMVARLREILGEKIDKNDTLQHS